MAQQFAFQSFGDHGGNLMGGHNVTEAKGFFNAHWYMATELWAGQRETHWGFPFCLLYAIVSQSRQEGLELIIFQFLQLDFIESVRGTHES